MQQLNENGKPMVDEHYIRPANAEKIMRNAHNARQTLYVYAPTGFGKTSFVADMLQRRRYLYLLAGDTDRLLEELAAVLAAEVDNKETIIVIDDLHLIESDETKERLLPILQGLIVRSDIWLVMISRADVPSWLKSLYIQNILSR